MVGGGTDNLEMQRRKREGGHCEREESRERPSEASREAAVRLGFEGCKGNLGGAASRTDRQQIGTLPGSPSGLHRREIDPPQKVPQEGSAPRTSVLTALKTPPHPIPTPCSGEEAEAQRWLQLPQVTLWAVVVQTQIFELPVNTGFSPMTAPSHRAFPPLQCPHPQMGILGQKLQMPLLA